MKTFVKAAIIKKKYYFGVTATGGEIIVVVMEREKNDRCAWINKCLIGSLKTLKWEPNLHLISEMLSITENRNWKS